MEVSNSLLVTLMFVGILTIGIGTILDALAGVVNRRAGLRVNRYQTNFIVLLLLIHLDFFWHVLEILNQEWVFLGFIFIISGPIILYFATNVLLPNPVDEYLNNPTAHYFSIAPQFFLLIALLQVWLFGVDFRLGYGIGAHTANEAIILLVALTLMRSTSQQLHLIGMIAFYVIYLASMAMSATGFTP